jgi:hypothetical protein
MVSTPAEQLDICPECRGGATLVDLCAADDCQVWVTTIPPLVESHWVEGGWRCPKCGTVYWVEPTGEQHAKWTREGTP